VCDLHGNYPSAIVIWSFECVIYTRGGPICAAFSSVHALLLFQRDVHSRPTAAVQINVYAFLRPRDHLFIVSLTRSMFALSVKSSECIHKRIYFIICVHKCELLVKLLGHIWTESAPLAVLQKCVCLLFYNCAPG
jgi:hypothetical protein